MGLKNKIKNIFGGKKAQSSTKRKNPTGYEVASYGEYALSTGSKANYLEAMKGWVFACVNAISDEVGSIQLKLYKKESNGDIVEVTDHKALDVLYKVNNFTTKFDHFWLTQAYLELAGESPWFVEKDKDNEPSAIYFLRPDKITPVPDKDQVISGYKYRIDSKNEITLNVDEVIFLKNPNPANPFRGKGTLENALLTYDIDESAELWNFKFFKNSARPDMIMTIKDMESLEPEQQDKLKKSIREAHQGLDKSHNLMVLFGDMLLEKFGTSHTDMDFMNQQGFTRDKLLSIFRVPKSVIALTEGVNFASSKTSIYTFSRFTIKPKMERIIQQLNEFYLPMFNDTENMFLDYESPVPEDMEEKLKIQETGVKNGWLTINEVRSQEGLEPLEGFDVPYMPLNLYPVGGDTLPEMPPEGEEEPSKEEAEPKEADEKTKKVKKKGYHNIERLRQMKARNMTYFNLEDKIKEVEANIKKKINEEITKSKKNKKKIDSKELELIKKKIKEEAGLDKVKESKKREEKIKIVIIKDDRLKKEYTEKMKKIDERLKHVKKLEGDKIIEKKSAVEETKKLRELRKKLISDYNSRQNES